MYEADSKDCWGNCRGVPLRAILDAGSGSQDSERFLFFGEETWGLSSPDSPHTLPESPLAASASFAST